MMNRPQGCSRPDAQPDQILCWLQNEGYEIKVLHVVSADLVIGQGLITSISLLVGQPITEMQLVGLSAPPPSP